MSVLKWTVFVIIFSFANIIKKFPAVLGLDCYICGVGNGEEECNCANAPEKPCSSKQKEGNPSACLAGTYNVTLRKTGKKGFMASRFGIGKTKLANLTRYYNLTSDCVLRDPYVNDVYTLENVGKGIIYRYDKICLCDTDWCNNATLTIKNVKFYGKEDELSGAAQGQEQKNVMGMLIIIMGMGQALHWNVLTLLTIKY